MHIYGIAKDQNGKEYYMVKNSWGEYGDYKGCLLYTSTLDKWKRVDDYPYGGSAGMVMQCEPIDRCIAALKAEREYDDVI